MTQNEILLLMYIAFGSIIGIGTYRMAVTRRIPKIVMLLTAVIIGSIWPVVFIITVFGMKKEPRL